MSDVPSDLPDNADERARNAKINEILKYLRASRIVLPESGIKGTPTDQGIRLDLGRITVTCLEAGGFEIEIE